MSDRECDVCGARLDPASAMAKMEFALSRCMSCSTTASARLIDVPAPFYSFSSDADSDMLSEPGESS